MLKTNMRHQRIPISIVAVNQSSCSFMQYDCNAAKDLLQRQSVNFSATLSYYFTAMPMQLASDSLAHLKG